MAEFLVISPHVDDEVIGCGGILDGRFHVHYCGVESRPDIGRQARLGEAEAVAGFLGFSYSVNLENVVNQYALEPLIGQFEALIGEQAPHTLFLPYPSYNQDHRTTLDAALVASRPHDVNHWTSNVLLYEQIQVVNWPYREDLIAGRAFHPNCYFPIDIGRKCDAYRLHKSQVRSMRSPAMLENLARFRGMQSGYELAEAFQAVRLCNPTALSLGRLKDDPRDE